MKKITSIILLITIISSCFVFSGCELFGGEVTTTDGEQTTTTTTTSTTTSTTTQTPLDDEPATIEFEHGDNFTEDDIEFVKMLHGQIRNDVAICDLPPQYSLENVLSFAKNGVPLFLARFENPYIICAYSKPDASEYECDKSGNYEFDATKYVWYKYYDSASILDRIDDMPITMDCYLLYDCVVIKDIVNDIEYNKNCKYYMQYTSEHNLELTKENMLLFDDYSAQVSGESKFIPYAEYGGATFEVYVDDDGTHYLYFDYESFYEDGSGYLNSAQKLFGEHYDAFQSHFVVLDEYINSKGKICKKAGVDLKMLVELLNKAE